MTDTALLLMDYQVALCDPGPLCRLPALAEQVETRSVLTAAAGALAAARRDGLYVAHVRLAFDPSFELRTNRSARFDAYPADRAMLVGSPEAAFMDAVAPLESEPVVTKGCVSSFIGTPLVEMLLGNGIRKVVLGGVATNMVVEATARHATDIGLGVTVLEDCCASFNPELHSFAIENIFPMFSTVVSSTELFG